MDNKRPLIDQLPTVEWTPKTVEAEPRPDLVAKYLLF